PSPPPTRSKHPPPYVPAPLGAAARAAVRLAEVARSRAVGTLAFGWQSGRLPVELPCLVLVDPLEPHALEPPRGSRTQISGAVPAVDDDRSASVELRACLGLDLSKWHVDGAGDVLLSVFLGRKDIHELCALRQQPLDLRPVDRLRHADLRPSALR